MQRKIQKAADFIKNGGVVVFPTTGLYGLGADAKNPDAVKRVFEIKKRPPEKPVLILIDEPKHLESIVAHIPEQAKTLMKSFWPGRLTLVFFASDHMDNTTKDMLTAKTGKIGVRLPAHPFASNLVKAAGRPITGTSANVSGEPGCFDPQNLSPELVEQCDMVLDHGILKGGFGSTIIDVTTKPMTIYREGAVKKEEIAAALNRRRTFF